MSQVKPILPGSLNSSCSLAEGKNILKLDSLNPTGIARISWGRAAVLHTLRTPLWKTVVEASPHPNTLLEGPEPVHQCRGQESIARWRAGQGRCHPAPHQWPQQIGNSFGEDETKAFHSSSSKHTHTSVWARRGVKGKNFVGQELTEQQMEGSK